LRLGYREDEVGGSPPGLERRHKVGPKFFLRTKDQLDLLTAILLERRDDLPDRLVLFGGLSLLPPHHEVGGLGAERREDQRGKYKGQDP
jgi:hypothetical protein